MFYVQNHQKYLNHAHYGSKQNREENFTTNPSSLWHF